MYIVTWYVWKSKLNLPVRMCGKRAESVDSAGLTSEKDIEEAAYVFF
jgi:hypothetical protein